MPCTPPPPNDDAFWSDLLTTARNTARCLVPAPELEDLTASVLLELLRRASSQKDQILDWTAYARQATRNACARLLRRNARSPIRRTLGGWEFAIEEDVIRPGRAGTLRIPEHVLPQLRARLTSRQNVVLTERLRHGEMQRVADALNLPVKTVRASLREIIKKLIILLQEDPSNR